MPRQISEQICTTALNGNQEKVEKIEQWQRRIDPYVGACTANLLRSE